MERRKRKKFLVNSVLIGSILAIMFFVLCQEQEENSIKEEKEIIVSTKEEESIIIQPVVNYPKETIINEYKGYDVEAKLEIPAISLETYILKNYSTKALNISVTKFWGASANEIGNFCIAGHNFKNKNMFRNLKKLKIGDKLWITENRVGKVEYEIYDVYKVLPEDISCLSQETAGNREATLITCTNDSEKRIIIKARELRKDLEQNEK